MDAVKKQKIQAIYQSVKDLTPEQKQSIILSMLVKNPSNHLLSSNNMLLLNRQAAIRRMNITFTIVGGFKQWLKHNRKVKKGKRGFYIAIPSKKENQESENNDETFFFYKSVFDISQTEEIKEEA